MRVSPSEDDDLAVDRGLSGSSEESAGVAPADTESADAKTAAASEDSDSSSSRDEDAAPKRGDTVFGYDPNPADGIVAIRNPTAQIPEELVPVYHFLQREAEENPPQPCGPLKRPGFLADQLTNRFTRQLLLEEQHHSISDANRDLFSEESKYLMARMAKEDSKHKRAAKDTMNRLLDTEAQSWSVKVAILKGFDLARGRPQEVHPPCKATWSTDTNYITYCDKVGILFALTDGTDTTALDLAAGAGGSRLKSRMEKLLYRWEYVLFFVEVPKTEDEGSTYDVTMIPNQYGLKSPFEEKYEYDGANETNRKMPDRRHVLVVPRLTALKIADKH